MSAGKASRAWPWMGLRSLRTRLTLWGGLIVGLCLTAYSMAVGASYAAHVEAELNRAAREDLELAMRSVQVSAAGVPTWPGGPFWREVREEEGGGHALEFWSTDGRRLLTVATIDSPFVGPPEAASLGAGPRSVGLAGGPFRVLVEKVELGGFPFVVRTAVYELSARKEVRALWRELAFIWLAVMSVGGVAGSLLVRRSLGPLARMAEHARRITAERLDERLLPEDAGIELNQLREAFNETLARLERSFDELRTFTAHASHELRTPLTAVRSVGEVALRTARSAAEYREVIGTMLEETDKLARLLNGLLALARADAGHSRLRLESVDLSALAHDVGNDLAVLAEEREQRLDVRDGGPVFVNGDRLALRQALQNLVDNAIRYSPRGTRVEVRVANGTRGAVVEVRDEGPGIPPAERGHVFERFFRGDAGRARPADGTGLGLSIVKGIVEAHAGRIELDSEEGSGSTFRLILPM